MWTPREIEFLDELPLTSAHKVDKVALRALGSRA
jgi:acyl-CoA synthetase (AMP-forming)/AMP-acid ligase II